mgnify:CR=1 FL=1
MSLQDTPRTSESGSESGGLLIDNFNAEGGGDLRRIRGGGQCNTIYNGFYFDSISVIVESNRKVNDYCGC